MKYFDWLIYNVTIFSYLKHLSDYDISKQEAKGI